MNDPDFPDENAQPETTAQAEADRRWPNRFVIFGGGSVADVRVDAFVAGAVWQAARMDGATDVGNPACYAGNPGEFAARWNARTEDERAAWLAAINEAFQRWASPAAQSRTVSAEQVIRDALVDAYNPQMVEHADHLADVARIAAAALDITVAEAGEVR
jgi:hypothetical protein